MLQVPLAAEVPVATVASVEASTTVAVMPPRTALPAAVRTVPPIVVGAVMAIEAVAEPAGGTDSWVEPTMVGLPPYQTVVCSPRCRGSAPRSCR